MRLGLALDLGEIDPPVLGADTISDGVKPFARQIRRRTVGQVAAGREREAENRITRRKEGLTETPVNVYATYRAELSRGASWKVAGARFFVVTISAGDSRMEGAVFEAPDGTRFVFRPFATRPPAHAVAAAAGRDTRVFAVRPCWGMPAPEWIAADPVFWKANPMARVREEP